jgi:hypothetical protein
MRSLCVLAALIAASLASCGSDPLSVDCGVVDPNIVGLDVSAIDSNDRPLRIPLRGTVVDGAFSDTLRAWRFSGTTPVGYTAATGRPGVYTITVQSAGYVDAVFANVPVNAGPCGGVSTTSVGARMLVAPRS